ncbi:MAG: hypothetical protein JSR44_04555 [Spirochaetes bacterium]|nr:hypothetical protein [Spirochaetota bacterium]
MVKILFFVIVITQAAFAAKKKYDEHGNIVANDTQKEGGVTTPAAPAIATAISTEGNPPATPPQQTSDTPTAPAPATNDEDAQAALSVRQPLTQVYLENARLYLRSNRVDKALEFFKKSQEAGEDAFSQSARLESLFVRARRGDPNLESETEGFDEKLRPRALLTVADGYSTCSREVAKKNDCGGEAERLYAYLSELAPRSSEGRLARLRLGLILVDAGKYEAALPHLVRTLSGEVNAAQALSRELPLDRAWYNLGQLYERPWYHRDAYKAQQAYAQVLKFDQSPYRSAARERLQYLKRFATGTNRF